MVNLKTQTKRNKLAIGVAAALALGACSAAFAADGEAIELDIRKSNVTSSLLNLSSASGIQIMIAEGVDKSLQLPTIKGSYQLDDALNQMLKGTGLVYEFVTDNSIIVKAAEEAGDDGNKEVDEEVVVTGTRLRNVSPTGQVKIITREDMWKRGVFTAEDIIRTLPQNFSTTNAGSTSANNQGISASAPSRSLGQSAANLRGLGNSATLVLVNNHRVAASPVFAGDGTVNLSTIPSSAIERVEILLEGASAIYGSDAMGGVVNFILRKDWTGAETAVRYENSSTGGDERVITQQLGTGWGSGNATMVLSYRESDNVDSSKAGFTTLDFTAQGGPDLRRSAANSPGNGTGHVYPFFLQFPSGFIFPLQPGLGALPEGFTGNDWTEDDLSVSNVEPFDSPTRVSGGTSDRKETSVTVTFSQQLSDTVSIDGDILYVKSENDTVSAGQQVTAVVPDTNPFNQLGSDVAVRFLFDEDSPLANLKQNSDSENLTTNLGVNVELPSEWQLQVNGNYSEGETAGFYRRLTQNLAFREALAGRRIDVVVDPVTGVETEVVTDEVVPAINLFTGEHDPDLDLGQFLLPDIIGGFDTSNQKTVSKTEEIQASANGTLFSLVGGDAGLAVGAQFRRESADYGDDAFGRAVFGVGGDSAVPTLLDRDILSAFFEGSLPIIGEANQLPGVQELLLTVAGRWEEYTMSAQFDGPGTAPRETSFSNFSPKVGIKWQIVDDFALRCSWTDAFTAPGLLSLGRPQDEAFTTTFDDPDAPGATPGNPVEVVVPVVFGGNPDLQPETAATLSLGIEWTPSALEGLTVNVNYTDIDWVDKIDTISSRDPRLADTLSFPQVFQRDADGNLVRLVATPVNLSSAVLEVVDVDINYQFDTDMGSFDFSIAGSYTLEAGDSISGDDFTETVETNVGPDRLVLKARAGWSVGDYGANMMVNYSSSYDHFEAFSGENLQRVEHYTTIDVTGFYNTGGGWRFNAGVRNLLDNSFPTYFNFRQSYDAQRVDTRGRIAFMEVARSFDF